MSPLLGRRPSSARRRLAAVLGATALAAVTACSAGADGAPVSAPASPASAAPDLDLGAGLLAFPDEASRWVEEHPDDPRAAALDADIAGEPTALWLTGDESFGNLADAVEQADAADRTMVLTLYNIPMRYDGLSDPTAVSLATYRRWIDRVAEGIGDTRAVVVLEPDALWFYDRMETDDDRETRMDALTYAVETLAEEAPRTRTYLEAGTSSGSVTADRMADLLVQAGVADAAGYAVNVSSYSPTDDIQAWAQGIRAGLQDRGIEDPRYVVDTGRNGASSWDFEWCNPPDQRLGRAPGVVASTDGQDLDLWVKAPGTSDGDCGPAGGGKGTYGGEFIPALAYEMVDG